MRAALFTRIDERMRVSMLPRGAEFCTGLSGKL